MEAAGFGMRCWTALVVSWFLRPRRYSLQRSAVVLSATAPQARGPGRRRLTATVGEVSKMARRLTE